MENISWFRVSLTPSDESMAEQLPKLDAGRPNPDQTNMYKADGASA